MQFKYLLPALGAAAFVLFAILFLFYYCVICPYHVMGVKFLEYVDLPWGARSGTLRSEIDRIRAHGRVPVLDLETDGALRVQETIPGAATIFVDAPTFAELERRLRERATESSGEIQVRLELARRQQGQKDRFDYQIVNDDVERAVEELTEIVRRELRTAGTMSRP